MPGRVIIWASGSTGRCNSFKTARLDLVVLAGEDKNRVAWRAGWVVLAAISMALTCILLVVVGR